MRTWKVVPLLAWLAMSLAASASLPAAEKCSECGQCCRKPVCRMVCEMKPVTEVHYKCVCEDFCLPGPSEKCGCKWIPTCGCPRTRAKLVKYETTKQVPTYKCVVEYVCCHCCPKQEQPSAAPLLSPPGDEPPALDGAAKTLP